MKKILFVLSLFLLLSTNLFGENILSDMSGDAVYSFRHKSITGDISVKLAKDFADGWLTAKAFFIPDWKEYGMGLEANLLKKIKDREEFQAFFKVVDLSLGLWGGIAIKEPVKKSQGDGGLFVTVIKIKF